jgi:hypothetical protein
VVSVAAIRAASYTTGICAVTAPCGVLAVAAHVLQKQASIIYADRPRAFRSAGVQLKPEAALGNTLAAIVTFPLWGELQWFRHFPHF